MSSPVSSRRLANLVKESLQGSVLGGVVSDAVLPAVSDDVKTAAWESALRVPPYAGPPMWFHGDLSRFNILTAQGRLTGVIDFGLMGVGDPSVDLIIAWNLLSAPARAQFRVAVGAADDDWMRGRGRALAIALIALPYYQDTNPPLAASARYAIGEVLADFRYGARPGC